MAMLGLGYSLVFWAIYMIFTILLVYIVAVKNGHVYPFLPTISHTGSVPPERNIFSELMEFGTFWCLVNLIIRYLQLEKAFNSQDVRLMRMNVAALWFGLLGNIGLATVTSWPVPSFPQDNLTMTLMHSVGSGIFYASIAVYMWLQTIITYNLWRANINSALAFAIRLALVSVYTAAGLAHVILDRSATRTRQQFEKVKHAYGLWKPGDVAYLERTSSDIAQWLTVFTLIAYALTFFKEFQNVGINVTCYPKNTTHTGSTRKDTQYTKLDANNTENESNVD